MSTSHYEKDFYQWLDRTIALVRDGRFDEVDRDILVDELESMGKRDKRELTSHFAILIAHLLKWRYQPSERSSGWRGSIAEQRFQITDQLEDSPSLKGLVPGGSKTPARGPSPWRLGRRGLAAVSSRTPAPSPWGS